MSAQKSGVCVLVSGGVESAALLSCYLETGEIVHPLFVRCGFWWESVELAWLRRQLKALRAPRLQALAIADAHPLAGVGPRHWSFGRVKGPAHDAPYDSVYLPGRNLVLLSCAAALCAERGLTRAAIGSMRGNPFRDASRSFFHRFENIARDSFGASLRVETPLRSLDKKAVIARWPRARYDLSFSCIRPRATAHCGRCSKCAERSEAVA